MSQNNFIKDPFISSQVPRISSLEVTEKFKEKMMEIKIKEKEAAAQFKAERLKFPYINLTGFPINPESLAVISENQAKELKIVCFFYGSGQLKLGTTDPLNPGIQKLVNELSEELHVQGEIYLISNHSLESALKLYASLPKPRKVTYGVEITEEEIERFKDSIIIFKDLGRVIKEISVTEMLSLIIAAALKSLVSDVHIEAEEKDVKIRFRIDGILHEAAILKKEIWERLIARIKLVSKLKINVTNRPQDGRFTISLTKEKIDVRVSCLPTSWGESVVMRILLSSVTGLFFEELGLRGKVFDDLKAEIEKPNGMVVTTGPTGSGKTTTLYAILNKLNRPGIKIITIEEPVEYKLEGINQSQVDTSQGYTFVTGLRSILRQDPDIIMVGEVRDLETTDLVVNAALTGHLVLTTLHTNDAAGSIPRFLSMGVKSFLLAPALNAMLGQRLVRRICQKCKIEDILDNKTFIKVKETLSKIPKNSEYFPPKIDFKKIKFYKGKGCQECQNLGYKGRIGIFELLKMSPVVEKLILSGHVSEYDMREVGIKQGMMTMVQDGLLKAIDGITTVGEVFRVAKN